MAGTARLEAQNAVELKAGGSSLYESYGVGAYLYTPRYTSWLGIGYQDGLRVGAALETSIRQDSLRIGSDVMIQRYATDLFSTGINILTQDIRYTWVRPRTVVSAAAGSAAATNGSQFFQAYSFDDPFGALTVRHQAEPGVVAGLDAVVASRQTALASAAWTLSPTLGVAATTGLGSNAGYGAVAVSYNGRRFRARGSYVMQGEGFRRADLPFPLQTEPDRENLQLEWEPTHSLLLGAARQNFVQDSAGGTNPIRASGTSAYASYTLRGVRAQAGIYDSESEGIGNLSSYVALGVSPFPWLEAEAYLLQSRPSVGPRDATPIVTLRERVAQRLTLMQQLVFNNDQTTIQLGGELITTFGSLGVGYQIIHQPFQPLSPFKSVLNLTARVQLGRYATSMSTNFLPDGSVNYTAGASTFLYFGQFGGIQPNLISTQMAKFVIKGRVVDELGQPVDGAALDFEGNLAFSNPDGYFQIRVGRPRAWKLKVDFTEFLTPGQWEVLEAPETVPGTTEEKARPVEVILRRVVSPPMPVTTDALDPPAAAPQSHVPR